MSSDIAVRCYNEILRFIGMYGGICGLCMTKPNFRPSAVTWFTLVMNISFIFSALFTTLTYDSDTAWLSATTVGIILQGLTKFAVLMTHHVSVYEKVQFLGSVYRSNQNSTSNNYCSLLLWSNRCRILQKYGSFAFAMACSAFVFWVFAYWLWTGELTVILCLMVPGVDAHSLVGYASLFIYHSIALIMAFGGTCAADFLLITLILHLWPLADIFDNMCVDLNVALYVKANRNTVELRGFFYNLLKAHLEMCFYLEDISRIYFYMVFVEIYTLALSLCILMFCLLTITHIPLYFMAASFFIQLFLYCLLGTIAEIAMDRIYMSLHSICWYLLPLSEKKAMLLALAKAQKPTILLAGSMPLNMDTFVEVMKTVYSVAMLLLNSYTS